MGSGIIKEIKRHQSEFQEEVAQTLEVIWSKSLI